MIMLGRKWHEGVFRIAYSVKRSASVHERDTQYAITQYEHVFADKTNLDRF